MESAISFLLCLIFLGLVTLGAAIAYKRRDAIAKWLNTPYYAESDRRLRLTRRIEDAEKELEMLDEKESKAQDSLKE